MNTTYFLNQVMGNIFKTKTNPALPSSYFIGLTTMEPTKEGVIKGEPSSFNTGYSRVQMTNLSAPVNGIITNTAAINFNLSTSDWGEMTHYIVCDAQTGGNLLFYGELQPNRYVDTNTIVTIDAGKLQIELCNP